MIDFGLGNLYSTSGRLKTPCGSPCYAPPEMITGQEYDPEKSDLWSAGITLFYLLAGRLPFNDKNIKELYKKIVDGTLDFPKNLSNDAIDLLRAVLRTNPRQRPSFKEVFAHPWMQTHKPPGHPLKREEEKVNSTNSQFDMELLNRVARCLNVSKNLVLKSLQLGKKNGFTAQ